MVAHVGLVRPSPGTMGAVMADPQGELLDLPPGYGAPSANAAERRFLEDRRRSIHSDPYPFRRRKR